MQHLEILKNNKMLATTHTFDLGEGNNPEHTAGVLSTLLSNNN